MAGRAAARREDVLRASSDRRSILPSQRSRVFRLRAEECGFAYARHADGPNVVPASAERLGASGHLAEYYFCGVRWPAQPVAGGPGFRRLVAADGKILYAQTGGTA